MKRVLVCLILLALFLPAFALSENETLRIDFLNVGKADAIIITHGTDTIVIDTATNKKGDAVVQKLVQLGCENVDLLIITHYDKDHVGGADKVIKALPVVQVYVPAYEKDSKQIRQLYEAIEEYGVQCERLSENLSTSVGSLQLYIDVANESDYGADEENDFSLVTSLRYGETSFLFTGDAENPRLMELLDEGTEHHDVLKVPHHGRFEKSSIPFFEAVSPFHAIITSSDKEPEDTSVVTALQNLGTSVWLTRNGNVVCFSDGIEVHVMTE